MTLPASLDPWTHDLRLAARGLRRAPSFTLTAAAALALGIGAASAVFSFADRILFRPLPYASPQDLVWFGMTAPIGGGTEFVLEQNFIAWQKQPTPFSAITVTAGTSDCTLSQHNPARLTCSRVAPNFLSLFGYRPLAGRDFTADDGRIGAPQSALISPALWRQRFAAAPLSGQELEIDGNPTRIVGVLPEDFETPSLARVDVLQVLQLPESKPASAPSLLLTAFARLQPGVSPVQARTRMEPLFEQALESVPPGFRKEVRFVIHPLRDRQIRDSQRAALLLLAAVLLVLLIAIANVANLSLARNAARQRELAIRAAIGASRIRLLRHALTESLLLALLGGAAGLGLAALLLRLLRHLAPAGIARLDQATLDWRLAGFSLLAALIAAMGFGLAPALRTPAPETLTGGRIAGRRRERLRPALVIVQIALSILLLSGAALLLQSLRNLSNAPLGFQTASLVSAYAQLPDSRYPQPALRAAFWSRVSQRIAAIPGVTAVGISDSLPPSGRAQARIFSSIHVEGRPRAQGAPTGGMVTVRDVSASYFSLLSIPVLQGRLFAEGDTGSIVLSQQMANRMFPGENPLGQRIVLTGESTLEVTAVVAGVRNGGFVQNSDPEIYLLSNRQRARQYILVKADSRILPLLADAFREVDPRLIVQLETLDERVDALRIRPRFQSFLLGGFALAGLLLTVIGLYGVVSLLTTQRTGEIGIRMALGATPAAIRALVLRQAAAWTLAGLALGAAGAYSAASYIESLLFEVKTTAPLPLAAAAALLTLAALAAAWLPARRASRLSPLDALRTL